MDTPSLTEQLEQVLHDAKLDTHANFGSTLRFLTELKSAVELSIVTMYAAGQLEAERDFWKRKYDEEITRSIQHSEAMMGNVLSALLHKPEASK